MTAPDRGCVKTWPSQLRRRDLTFHGADFSRCGAQRASRRPLYSDPEAAAEFFT